MERKEVAVSVICNAFNQERYIRKTLDGFVNQITNFPFEVIVHDDASTDRTADIIREYEKKYPEIMIPIYETENQYSKGIKISGITKPFIRGRYVSLCEGDDWWTDNKKLQIQFDYMEANPHCTMCTHASTRTDKDGNMLKEVVRPFDNDTDITVDQMIEGGGGFIPTNSLFMRKEIRDNLPKEFFKYKFGDYQTQILMAYFGQVHYFNRVMSNYTVLAYGSWTEENSKDKSKKIKGYNDVIILLKEFDKFSNGKYSKSISNAIRKSEFSIILEGDDTKKLFKKEYREYFMKIPPLYRAKLRLKAYCPTLLELYEKLINAHKQKEK